MNQASAGRQSQLAAAAVMLVPLQRTRWNATMICSGQLVVGGQQMTLVTAPDPASEVHREVTPNLMFFMDLNTVSEGGRSKIEVE
jgi:hypothetical protein